MKMIAGVMLIWSATAILIAAEVSGSRTDRFFMAGWVQAIGGLLLLVWGVAEGRGDGAGNDHPANK